ncbi:metallophosphoesterase [Hoylesella pleuritidis]|uniref:metallophosphoesterase n=1 Tax=Hoylesella pleuritidis TaxID=407975 RepID=UPI0028D65504|nr:metallophosphoesterase [Hoylesella pleuritidis]
MIARIFIPIILAIVLPDLYFDLHYLRSSSWRIWWKRLLWWLPSIGLLGYTVALASIRNFAPDDLFWLNLYLFLVGSIVTPKAIFAFCSGLGLLYCRLTHTRNNWGNLVAPPLCLFSLYILIYGSTLGFRKLEVRHIDIYSRELPKAFDGYRIAQFTDAHVGTLTGNRYKMLTRVIDSLNAQNADAIVFTGDLQNMQPSELYPVQDLLKSLHAKDGVFSVLGNHDYSQYIKADPAVKAANEREVISRERQFGWTVLLNEHHTIRRGKDSLVIAGEENDGLPPFPDRGDINKTLEGISPSAYVVMLQHDPSAWRRSILPKSQVQLTLSGHTHGGQIQLFGLRPTMLTSKEDYGLYLDGNRALYVSAGIGGLIPFRFGIPGEIAVITLHKLQ